MDILFFHYESNFKIFFGGWGWGARLSNFFFTKNPNLKKNFFGGWGLWEWASVLIFLLRIQIEKKINKKNHYFSFRGGGGGAGMRKGGERGAE